MCKQNFVYMENMFLKLLSFLVVLELVKNENYNYKILKKWKKKNQSKRDDEPAVVVFDSKECNSRHLIEFLFHSLSLSLSLSHLYSFSPKEILYNSFIPMLWAAVILA